MASSSSQPAVAVTATGLPIPHLRRSITWVRTDDIPIDQPYEAEIEKWIAEENDGHADISLARHRFLEGRDIFRGIFDRYTLLCAYEKPLADDQRIVKDGEFMYESFRTVKATWKDGRLANPGNEKAKFTVLNPQGEFEKNYPPLLGVQMAANSVRGWGVDFKFTGKPTYLKGYNEWARFVLQNESKILKGTDLYDGIFCSLFLYNPAVEYLKSFLEVFDPRTNTAYTQLGEIGITLMDVKDVFGLPITGEIYDEAIGPDTFLFGRDAENKRYVRSSCVKLFEIYSKLAERRKKRSAHRPKVLFSEWISFFLNEGIVENDREGFLNILHPFHPSQAEASEVTDEGDGGSFGYTLKSQMFKTSQFDELVRDTSIDRGTFLSGFIALWICYFACPSGTEGRIRPEVFIMADAMATGRKVAIGIHVYAHLHRCFSRFINSDPLGSRTVCGPLHYFYGWLGNYISNMYTCVCPEFYLKGKHPVMLRIAGAVANTSSGSRFLARMAFRSPACHSFFDHRISAW